MTPKQSKAEDYRRLAQEATAHAEAAILANVREKHEGSALQWTALAELQEQALHQTVLAPAPAAVLSPL
jgi:hypothetical protein